MGIEGALENRDAVTIAAGLEERLREIGNPDVDGLGGDVLHARGGQALELAAERGAHGRLQGRAATTLSEVTIEHLRPDHWDAVARIYAQGIATGNATFETEVPSWERWDASHLADHRLVAVRDGRVVGWAALSPVSKRCVYSGVAEESVYVAEEARGEGVGRKLLEALIAGAEAAGIWTIQTGIFPENEASVRLHERAGFRIVGTRERLGKQGDVWRDVLFLERRSPIVG
jgi:L-amino acid N-acyltransferase YncA